MFALKAQSVFNSLPRAQLMKLYVGIRFAVYNGWIPKNKLFADKRLKNRLQYMESLVLPSLIVKAHGVIPKILITYSSELPDVYIRELRMICQRPNFEHRVELLPVTKEAAQKKMSAAFDEYLTHDLHQEERYCFIRLDDDDCLLPDYFTMLDNALNTVKIETFGFSGSLVGEMALYGGNDSFYLKHIPMSAAGLALCTWYGADHNLITAYDLSWSYDRKLLRTLRGHPNSDLDVPVVVDGTGLAALLLKHDHNVSQKDWFSRLGGNPILRRLLRPKSPANFEKKPLCSLGCPWIADAIMQLHSRDD